MWWSEYDAQWQNDEFSAFIHPEAALYANKAMQMACMADAAAVNMGYTLDFTPGWHHVTMKRDCHVTPDS